MAWFEYGAKFAPLGEGITVTHSSNIGTSFCTGKTFYTYLAEIGQRDRGLLEMLGRTIEFSSASGAPYDRYITLAGRAKTGGAYIVGRHLGSAMLETNTPGLTLWRSRYDVTVGSEDERFVAKARRILEEGLKSAVRAGDSALKVVRTVDKLKNLQTLRIDYNPAHLAEELVEPELAVYPGSLN